MKNKIAFVCQRYGLEVNGGAELYCRQVAEKLTVLYDVTVYTTCAVDYVTWRNYYTTREEDINGVHVKRFPVSRERNNKEFSKIHGYVMNNPGHTAYEEEEWIEKQGPICDALLNCLDQERHQYNAILFMTYLYYLTIKGIIKDYNNAILIPTVHDEPPVYLRIFDKVFASAKGIVWNTEEERAFARRRFPFVKDIPEVMTGIGIEGPKNPLPELPDAIKNKRYILYAGRIDTSKGCGELFDFFLRYKSEHSGSQIKLVLMGKPVMKIPNHPDIISLGFVSEEMKYAVMGQSVALLLHSHFESLSMVVLESMYMNRPVLVSGKCNVLKGHCIRSNAGLYFDTYEEYSGALDYLLTHPLEYEQMRVNGKKYVNSNYRWEVIIDEYRKIIQIVGNNS